MMQDNLKLLQWTKRDSGSNTMGRDEQDAVASRKKAGALDSEYDAVAQKRNFGGVTRKKGASALGW